MTNNKEIFTWFDSISSEEWFEASKIAAEKCILKPKERQLLYNMGKYSSRKDIPTEKQLNYAYSVYQDYYEKIEKLNDLEEISKANNSFETIAYKHMTIRVAWHDNKWNGKICSNPEANEYCIGEHSLLSKRIRQNRKTDFENDHKAEIPDLDSWGYLPPCYWSINLTGTEPLKTFHLNAAESKFPIIQDNIKSNTVYTWPFKLSFNRDNEVSLREGKYPKNLVARIERFRNKFRAHESIVFLYANYSNPISGDEDKYLIIGCALLGSDIEPAKEFTPQKELLDKKKSTNGNQNFPTINWALKVNLDFPDNGILLPYHEYLEEAERDNFYDKLDEIKVTVDESDLVHSFKYVAMDVDDDVAIYILSKIKRSLYIIKEHGRFESYNVDIDIQKIERFLKIAWEKRGHFPGFSVLSNTLVNIQTNNKNNYEEILEILRASEGNKYYDKLLSLLDNNLDLPDYLEKYEDDIFELRDAIIDVGIKPEQFLRLSIMNLNSYQFKRILKSDLGESSSISIKEICDNPYILYEEYKANSIINENTGEDLDSAIPLFKIDISLFPDKYLKRIRNLQNYTITDERRIRALVLDYLWSLENAGHCFDEASIIENYIKKYPLFYKTEYFVRDGILNEYSDNTHLKSKLKIVSSNGKHYFYLREIYTAEEKINKYILGLINKDPLTNPYQFDLNKYLDDSIEDRKNKIRNFDEKNFRKEREKFFNNIFEKRFYIISGAPGTGKSNLILSLLKIFYSNDEKENIVLAPTGKATLRLNLNEEKIEDIEAKTIDKFLNEYSETKKGTIKFNNLIIDEMSMVDLLKLKELFDKLNFSSHDFKRIIFVGDHNQLPPIGFGRVFVDTIKYLIKNSHDNNYIYLQVNCRQELDTQIIDFARIFSNQKKNYEPLLQKVNAGISISDKFHIEYWKDRIELRTCIKKRFMDVFMINAESDIERELNMIFGLREDGSVNNSKFEFRKRLSLESFQIISPYRATYYGTIGLNNYFQSSFRTKQNFIYGDFPFKNSDKVIQIKNKYSRRQLILSNGSIGVVCGDKFYFAEHQYPLKKSDLDNDFLELAYAITVHKAQGSGFEHVFLVIPNKLTLLSRELIYTALTRSKKSISLFIFGKPNEPIKNSILTKIQNTTNIDIRKTTLFEKTYWDYSYTPAKNAKVKSRVEYIIYKKLEETAEKTEGFSFEYEKEYPLENESFSIHPDFTIFYKEKIYYWEHLGLLEDLDYVQDWFTRLKFYKDKGDFDQLLTTDERRGINDDNISIIVKHILEDRLVNNDLEYSQHHYSLG